MKKIFNKLDCLKYKVLDFYCYKIRPLVKPNHALVRKSVARGYSDLVQVILDVNFAIIQEFYEKEYLYCLVDWEATEEARDFAKWLKEAYLYVTYGRKQLKEQLAAAYPETSSFDEMWKEIEDFEGIDKTELGDESFELKSCEEIYGKPYEEVYAEVNRLEKLINDTDTEVLNKMIQYRGYFWT